VVEASETIMVDLEALEVSEILAVIMEILATITFFE
jgi:hypothetical protein